jgi:hypothetical protein
MTDEELINLYHQTLSSSQLAKREDVDLSWLNNQWRRLRRSFLLPPGPRHHNVQTTMVSEQPLRKRGEDVHSHDGRPSVGMFNDSLLEKLFEVHKHPRWDFFHHPKRKKSSEQLSEQLGEPQ